MPLSNVERANDVAEELLGTARNLSDVLTPEELDDAELLAAIEEQVKECGTCGWWTEADDVDDDDNCGDCQDK